MIGNPRGHIVSFMERLSFRPSIKRGRGVVLVAALWICALIMWFAFQISAETHLQGEETVLSIRKSQAFHYAVGGCYEALARMGQPPPLRINEPPDLNWQPDGKPRIVEYRTGNALVIIEPEDSKVNVNKAGPLQIRQILEKAGVEETRLENLADAILDFIDQDDTPRIHGMEKDAYRAGGLNHIPFNGALTSLDQLLLVPGITQQLYYGYYGSEENGSGDIPEIFRDCLVPGRYSLFRMLTIYGSNTGLSRILLERDAADAPVTWKPGGTYRILSFGKSVNGPPAVGISLTVRFSPDGRNPYKVLGRKVL